MSAIRLLQAERHEDIQHLHRQLMTGGLLQKELLEEAEGYLIQKGIYDVTLIEECDFRGYKKLAKIPHRRGNAGSVNIKNF